jgi:hypothetical protein
MWPERIIMFTKLEGDQALMKSGGVFKVVDLYAFEDGLYAQWGTGFVRLYQNGSTTKPKLFVEKLVTDRPIYRDVHGRLTLKIQKGSRGLLATFTTFPVEDYAA